MGCRMLFCMFCRRGWYLKDCVFHVRCRMGWRGGGDKAFLRGVLSHRRWVDGRWEQIDFALR